MNARTMFKYGLASVLYRVVSWKQKLPCRAVLKSFDKKFPKAKYTSWQRMAATVWEAAFLWQDKEHTSLFKENGLWLETHTYMPLGNVPPSVRESFRKENTTEAMVKIFQLKTPQGTYYEFQIYKGQEPRRIGYDAQGKRIENSIL